MCVCVIVHLFGVQKNTLVKKCFEQLRQVLEAKLGDDVWSYVSTTPEGDGLELWRMLCAAFNPSTAGTATAIEQQLMKLPVMTTPESITQGRVQFNHHLTEHSRKAGDGGQLSKKSKIMSLMRIAPKAFKHPRVVAHVLLLLLA